MCICIGIEDLVANAIIELSETTDSPAVLFKDLDKYGATVIRILNEGIRLKDHVKIEELWIEFRGYLSVDVMLAFMDRQSKRYWGCNINVQNL